MLISKLLPHLMVLTFFSASSLVCRDIILEFKAAYFLPTSSVFRDIYNNGGALFGPEMTFNIGDTRDWYGFVSVDYFQKSGRSLGLCDATKVSLLPLGVGIKYFLPFWYDYADFYIGLGFQPVLLHTNDCSPYVFNKRTKWGFGGIAKVGVYVDLPHDFILDFFIDYSFVKVSFNNGNAPTGLVTPLKTDISGTIFGVGLGYRFN